MVGFKSKRAMAVPRMTAKPKEILGWREKCEVVRQRGEHKYGRERWNDIVSDCMDFMQRNYPGKYHTLKWYKGYLEPVFADPKHETIWLLKYGAE
jgi:hypothetical protein